MEGMAMKPLTQLPELLRATIIELVRREEKDLTCRQLAVLLICYLKDGPHTVRDLATQLAVAQPAITRAIDRLEQLALAKRSPSPSDLRSIIVDRTAAGHAFLAELRRVMATTAADLEQQPEPLCLAPD
jgi:DNA-binding MarR family transcriptional regulator